MAWLNIRSRQLRESVCGEPEVGAKRAVPLFLLRRFKRRSADAPEACAPKKEKKPLRERIADYRKAKDEAREKILEERNGQSWFMEKFYNANERMFRFVERSLQRFGVNPDTIVEKLGYKRSFKIAKFASRADIVKDGIMLAFNLGCAAIFVGGIALIVYLKNRHGVDVTGGLGQGAASYGDVAKLTAKQSFSLSHLLKSTGFISAVVFPLLAYNLLARPLDIFQVILVRNIRKNAKGETPEKEAEIERAYRGFLFNTYLEIVVGKLLGSLPLGFLGPAVASSASIILERRQLNFIKRFEAFAPKAVGTAQEKPQAEQPSADAPSKAI